MRRLLQIPNDAAVLFVDDSIGRRHWILSRYRLPHAFLADNANDAIQILKQGTIDIVFLDYDLAPGLGLSSESVAQYLAETKSAAQIFLHSENPFGIEVLKRILPNATVMPFGTFEILRIGGGR